MMTLTDASGTIVLVLVLVLVILINEVDVEVIGDVERCLEVEEWIVDTLAKVEE